MPSLRAMTRKPFAAGGQFINFCWKARRDEAGGEGTLLHEPVAGTEALFSGNGIDHFVMAITAAEATARHIAPCQMARAAVLS